MASPLAGSAANPTDPTAVEPNSATTNAVADVAIGSRCLKSSSVHTSVQTSYGSGLAPFGCFDVRGGDRIVELAPNHLWRPASDDRGVVERLDDGLTD